jgi:hypothetical protein
MEQTPIKQKGREGWQRGKRLQGKGGGGDGKFKLEFRNIHAGREGKKRYAESDSK